MEQQGIKEMLAKVAEVELVYKSRVKSSERPVLNSSADAAELFKIMWEEGKLDLVEQFKVLLLNRANKVISIFNVSSGGITGTVADPRLIFMVALKLNAVALILCHNHPSGNLKPSRQDEDLTLKIANGGKLLDIRVIDHIILTSEGYFSFADQGLL